MAGLARHKVFGRRGREDRRLLIHGVHRQGALSKLIDRRREPLVRRLHTAFEREREVEYGDFRFDHDGVRSPGGFLPWRIKHVNSAEGTNLTITTPDGQVLGGWVPERTTAEKLLREPARR